MWDTMLSFWCKEGLVVSPRKAFQHYVRAHLFHTGELYWVLSISFRVGIGCPRLAQTGCHEEI